MTQNTFGKLPANGGNPRQVAQVVNLVVDGKQNNLGSVTLTASSTTSTVTDYKVGADSCILLMPTTANAAAETVHVSARSKNSFTLTHASASTTDRTFVYAVIG